MSGASELRAARRLARGAAGGIGALWLHATLACSLTRPDLTECSSSSRCRDVFGPGYVCNSDGLCERAPASPRCTSTFPEDLLTRPDNHPSTIMLGSLMDRSVTTHQAREAAIRLATMQVVERGGLFGQSFGVVFCDISKNAQYDSLERTQAAVDSATYLANAIGVTTIIGPSASTDALEVYAAVKGRDVVIISPAATSPALTDAEGALPTDESPGQLWRTAPPDTIQALAIAKYFAQQTPKVTSVAVIVEKGAYGEALGNIFLGTFLSGGGAGNIAVYSSTSERDAAVLEAGKLSAEWIVFVSSQTADAAAFLNGASTLSGYATKNLFLTDSAANADLLSDAANAASLFPRVRGSRPAIPQGPVYEQFRASFSAAFQADANNYSFVAHSYDAAWLSFFGSAWSLGRDGFVHGFGIAKGLRHVSFGPPAPIEPSSWIDVAGELAAGRDIDLTGASGKLDFDGTTEETRGPTDIWKISGDGKTIEVETTINP